MILIFMCEFSTVITIDVKFRNHNLLSVSESSFLIYHENKVFSKSSKHFLNDTNMPLNHCKSIKTVYTRNKFGFAYPISYSCFLPLIWLIKCRLLDIENTLFSVFFIQPLPVTRGFQSRTLLPVDWLPFLFESMSYEDVSWITLNLSFHVNSPRNFAYSPSGMKLEWTDGESDFGLEEAGFYEAPALAPPQRKRVSFCLRLDLVSFKNKNNAKKYFLWI